mgnify:FL=1
MLKIINDLKPFFEDNYRRINVREYSRIISISPPTASKLLEEYRKEGLLKREDDKNYFYYLANKESSLFIALSRIYHKNLLEKSGLIEHLEKDLLNPIIVLFGSLSKAEAKNDSDIDLAIFTPTKKEISLKKYEAILKREIQLFVFEDRKDVKNINLFNNILNGYKITGNW